MGENVPGRVQVDQMIANQPRRLGKSPRDWLVRMGIPVGGRSLKDVRDQTERISRCRLGSRSGWDRGSVWRTRASPNRPSSSTMKSRLREGSSLKSKLPPLQQRFSKRLSGTRSTLRKALCGCRAVFNADGLMNLSVFSSDYRWGSDNQWPGDQIESADVAGRRHFVDAHPRHPALRRPSSKCSCISG